MPDKKIIIKTPILYSFRRCPYAIRARLALNYAQISIEFREIVLKNKPPQMLALSPKGTVPVLLTTNNEVIDESLEIMRWALTHYDPDLWLNKKTQSQIDTLIFKNDGRFKYYLDRYKYADRFPEFSEIAYRQQAELFLVELEFLLNQHLYLTSHSLALADIALFPFIRQFANVDVDWFWQSDYLKLQAWLQSLLESELFLSVMKKHPPWNF